MHVRKVLFVTSYRRMPVSRYLISPEIMDSGVRRNDKFDEPEAKGYTLIPYFDYSQKNRLISLINSN
jgi:hypothetical protein